MEGRERGLQLVPPEGAERLADRRLQRLHDVAMRRMRGVATVLEGLHDDGNRSAVYRTSEALGFSEVHVVRPGAATKRDPRSVSRGAEKWLDVRVWEETADCVADLRARGYRIYVADVRAAVPLWSIDFSRPTALAFGHEHLGASEALLDAADGAFLIPMTGLVESFNISVAAGIALSHARLSRERALGATTDLSESERQALFDEYVGRALQTRAASAAPPPAGVEIPRRRGRRGTMKGVRKGLLAAVRPLVDEATLRHLEAIEEVPQLQVEVMALMKALRSSA